MRLLAVAALLVAPSALAQAGADTTAHRLPFASTGNAVELAVANASPVAMPEGVAVMLVAAPPWLRFGSQAAASEGVAAGGEAPATFAFDVLPEAPVGEVAEVSFEVRAWGALVGTRTFRVVVEPPREVALAGPRPNPTRGATLLAFDLPAAGRATLRLYDVLGREVALLVDEERAAGRHEVTFAAGALAAGVYVVRLTGSDGAGSPVSRTQRLTVAR